MMLNPENLLRPHIRAMDPYTPILPFEVLSEQLGFPADQIIKLDANENPYGPIPPVAEALAELPYTHIYPDPESRLLRQAISRVTGVPFENILAGAGADELIDLIMRLLLDPGDFVLNCPPTFGMYHFDAEVNAARVISVPRKANFELDLDGIAAAVAQNCPKVLFLASPNNPDGGLLPPEVISVLLDLPLILVLDEAYIDFAETDSLISWVSKRDNLIVLRTFSKWPGLAGLRVGYGAFPAWMMPHLWKIKQPYNVSVAASTAAIVSLENVEQLEARTALIVSERERLYRVLQAIPWLQPYPSQANFILCRVKQIDAPKGNVEIYETIGTGKRSAAQLKADLAQKHGILIRYFDKPGLRDHIRISVGKPEHTEALLQAMMG
jgi:histidinol-phosphate aminotransferase